MASFRAVSFPMPSSISALRLSKDVSGLSRAAASLDLGQMWRHSLIARNGTRTRIHGAAYSF